MTQLKDEKHHHIETLRGIACILLVVYHIIGGSDHSGLKVPDSSFWRFLTDMLGYIRMPLFAFISGYIYAAHTIKPTERPIFYLKKLRRLGLPLLTASFIFLCLSHIVGTSYAKPWAESYNIYLYGYAHFWYLQASILIFAIVLGIETLNGLQSRQRTLLILAMSIVALSILPSILPNIFSLHGMFYLLPFFLCGLFIRRFKIKLNTPQKTLIMVFCGFGLLLLTLNWMKWVNLPINLDKENIPLVVLSIAACMSLYALRIQNKTLSFIGHYSYAIFLYHFAQSGVRMGLEIAAPATPSAFVFLLCFSGGILIPISLQMASEKFPVLNLMLFGTKLKKTTKRP